MDHQKVIERTKSWIEQMVIGLNLCPFAAKPFITESIRYVGVTDIDSYKIIETLHHEMQILQVDDAVETTLLVLADAFPDFYDFSDFLHLVDDYVAASEWYGVFHIASFHPEYCFEGTHADDVENYTNRAPYPVLHILRESSLKSAVASDINTTNIPNNNIKNLRALGIEAMRKFEF